MLLTRASFADGFRADVRVARGVIESVAPAGALGGEPGEETLDLAGYVLLPAPVEPHAHLDKAFTADRVRNPRGDLRGAIDAWHAYRRTLGVDEIAERARKAALAGLANGAVAVRSHVDVGEGIRLRAAEALVRVREELHGLVDVQVVAMTYPLAGSEGTSNRDLLREALALGVDAAGGAPHVDPRPREHLELCLALAAEAGRPVDLHMDEHTRPGDLDLTDLVRLAHGFPSRVVASHCVSLGMQPPGVQAEIAAAVAAARVAVVTCPLTNLFLQGRDTPTATPRGLTALRPLLAAGALVAAGGDNTQDPFNPLGRCDPLATAQLLVAAGHLDCESAYALVSTQAREAMGLPPVRIERGFPADLLAIAAGSLREAIATATEARIVLKAGRVVARTRVEREPPALPTSP